MFVLPDVVHQPNYTEAVCYLFNRDFSIVYESEILYGFGRTGLKLVGEAVHNPETLVFADKTYRTLAVLEPVPTGWKITRIIGRNPE